VSAEFIQTTTVDDTPFAAANVGPNASNRRPAEGGGAPSRVYILAFDVGSLGVGDSRFLVRSALTFIDRLLSTDRIGLHTFPIGPRIDPTDDHVAVRQLVQGIVGSRANSEGSESRFKLSPSEVIDIMAESVRASPFATRGMTARGTPVAEDGLLFGGEADTIRAVQMRECGAADVRCGEEIRAEAMSLATRLEAHAVGGLNGLRSLVKLLSSYPGRKTVVMVTAGMPTSDRPGGRPDLGTLPRVLGRDAAATNTAIYTLHVDSTTQRALGAASGRATGSANTRSRDRAVESQVLEEFADASGGALIRVATGAGEEALARVLRETSSHYLLGVEPEPSDRDGTLRELSVKVRRNGATIRSREWVTVPPRGQVSN
jgi:VWFA-related protein